MLKLNLIIRLVAFLFLSSSCYTSLVQSVCNGSSDLVGLYYTEQRSDLASVFLYLNTSTNTNTNTSNNNLNKIPSQITMHKRDASLTSAVWIKSFDSSHNNHLRYFNMIVVCSSCVDSLILRDFRLFYSYSLWQKKTLDSVSLAPVPSLDVSLFRELHGHRAVSESLQVFLCAGIGMSFSFKRTAFRSDITVENSTKVGFQRGYVDGDQHPDANRDHPPLKACSEPGLSLRAIVGITLGVLVVVISHARYIYNVVYKRREVGISSTLLRNGQAQLMPVQELAGITVDNVVEFSYEELSKATNDFNLAKKIGQGGFGAVYYAELRGEKVAIKKMDMQASKQFLAELKVLTHVHHINLVRLIGYCVEGSHSLVYEYIENGNLSQLLQGLGRDPLLWSTRVQIALDSARGLEYIHEYTVSVFIHCDIKSANILIDKNFRGKVADFGLTRLTEVGSRSRLVGTFGYMSPEYARYGDVTPKVDVYAFGVVLYELISAKKAIIKESGSNGEPKGLIALFDEVLSQADPKDGLVKMIDPRLGDNYPLDSVYKMAQIAKACTHEDPYQRPHMRSIVVALTNLSSSV